MMPSSTRRPNRKLLPPGVKASLPVMARFESGPSAMPAATAPAAKAQRAFGSASALTRASSHSATSNAMQRPAAAMWLGTANTITAASAKHSQRASSSLRNTSM